MWTPAQLSALVVITMLNTSHSMAPVFNGGEQRKVIHKSYNELKKGDIVIRYFPPPIDLLVVHRLHQKVLIGDGWKTKGDNNKFVDIGALHPDTYGGVVLP